WQNETVGKLRRLVFCSMPVKILYSRQIYHVEAKGRGNARTVVFFAEPELYEKNRPFEKFANQHALQNESWDLWFPRFYDIPTKENEPGGYSYQEVHAWTRKSPPNYVERSVVLLGGTIDELKVYYFLASLRGYEEQIGGGGKPTKVVGIGKAGIL